MNPQVPTDFSIFPIQASKIAGDVDTFYLFMVAISAFFIITIPGAIIYMAVKYRRRPGNEGGRRVETSKTLELAWTIIPFFIVMGMFFWGTHVFFEHATPNPNALEILTTGKKWMWKFQHKNGRREINDLHIPVNTPIRFKMSSEDVIHSLYFPNFRQKQDVNPGFYTYLNIEATRPGVYHLFCNQYCGTQHSNMIGTVNVMTEGDYQKWLGGFTGDPPEKVGEALFTSLACNTCHSGESGSRGPILNGIVGSEVGLQGGNKVTVDDSYIRESILTPQAKIVAGYQPIMPSFNGVVSQDQINALIAYIKTLPAPAQGAHATGGAGTSSPGAAPSNAAANDSTTTPTQAAPAENVAQQPASTENNDAASTSGSTTGSNTTAGSEGTTQGQQLGVQ